MTVCILSWIPIHMYACMYIIVYILHTYNNDDIYDNYDNYHDNDYNTSDHNISKWYSSTDLYSEKKWRIFAHRPRTPSLTMSNMDAKNFTIMQKSTISRQFNVTFISCNDASEVLQQLTMAPHFHIQQMHITLQNKSPFF